MLSVATREAVKPGDESTEAKDIRRDQGTAAQYARAASERRARGTVFSV